MWCRRSLNSGAATEVRPLSRLRAGLSHMSLHMPDVSMSRPCERRDPSVSAIALIAAARTLVSALEQRPFFTFEARGYGSLRSQGGLAERLCEATTVSAHAEFGHMR